MKRTVTVVIPTYNRATLVRRAISSVLAQSYRGFELIVVDDGSEDDTARQVQSFGDNVTYIRQENRGPSAARNLGVKMSRTNLIAFLDSDDWWDKEKLSIQLGEMQKNPDYPISHTQEIWYKNGKLLNQKDKHRKFNGYIFDKCIPICAVSMSTVVIRKELFDTVGLLDEDLPCCEDYDFWLRVSANHPFLLVDKPLALKEGGNPDQVSYIYRTGMDRFRIKALTKILSEPDLLSDEQRELAFKELSRKCHIYGNGCIKRGKQKEGKQYLELPRSFAKV